MEYAVIKTGGKQYKVSKDTIIEVERLSFKPEENFSFEANILPKLIEMKQLSGYLTSERYYSITTPDKISVVAKYFSSINLLK